MSTRTRPVGPAEWNPSPDLLTRIVVDAIEALTDTSTRDAVLALEAEQRSALVARVNDMED